MAASAITRLMRTVVRPSWSLLNVATFASALAVAGCVSPEQQASASGVSQAQDIGTTNETFAFLMRHSDRAGVTVSMKAGDTVSWSWNAIGGTVAFTVSGPSTSSAGATTTFRSGERPHATGTLTAQTAGKYSWSWLNHRGPQAILKLTIAGQYETVSYFGYRLDRR